MVEIGRRPSGSSVADRAIVAAGDVSGILAHGDVTIMAAVAGTLHLLVIDPHGRYPGLIAVAVFTDVRSLDMVGILTCRRGAVVTTGTAGGHAGVIEIRRYPARGGMTNIAIVARGNMVGPHTDGDGAIVTTGTGTHHIRVIHANDGHPFCIAVAILASIVGRNMLGVFARRRSAVMTAGTVAAHQRVIEGGRHPAIDGMASLTIITALDMLRMLANGNVAVMTAVAGTHDLTVIDPDRRYPVRGAMAILAQIAGPDVVGILTCCRGTVVATGTVIGHIGVVEIRRYPARRGVTGKTVIRCLQMIRTLADSGVAVMTTAASTGHVGVIDPGHGNPTGDGVTILAAVVGRHVFGVLTAGLSSVMTTDAVTRDAGVIIGCRRPACRGVAVGADIATGDMVRSLALRHGTVVAARTGTEDLGMIDLGRWNPLRVAMAILTDVAASNVGIVLAGGRRSVMAGRTVRRHVSVIEIGR